MTALPIDVELVIQSIEVTIDDISIDGSDRVTFSDQDGEIELSLDAERWDALGRPGLLVVTSLVPHIVQPPEEAPEVEDPIKTLGDLFGLTKSDPEVATEPNLTERGIL